MSLADESNVPHRPPQIGDRVEVRIEGVVVNTAGAGAGVVVRVDPADLSRDEFLVLHVERPADQVAILREISRDQPRPSSHSRGQR